MGSQKLRLPSNKKFTTSIVRGFESPMDGHYDPVPMRRRVLRQKGGELAA